MAFYKKQYNKKFGVYYPTAIVVGQPVTTKAVAKRLSQMCGDVRGRDGGAGRAGGRDGGLDGAGQKRAPGRTGNVSLHAEDERRGDGGGLRLPEAGGSGARAVCPAARGGADQGQHGHTRTGALGHRVDGLRCRAAEAGHGRR